jgi:general secretion pathway protein G
MLKNDKNNRRRGRGFTLIELLLVLVILAVLAALVVPKFAGRTKQSKITGAKTDISSISTALDAFEIDNGRVPTSEEGLEALVNPPAGVAVSRKYLDRVPKDPWNNPYVYKAPGQHNNDYDLYSLGEDGREGNDDITNWEEKK